MTRPDHSPTSPTTSDQPASPRGPAGAAPNGGPVRPAPGAGPGLGSASASGAGPLPTVCTSLGPEEVNGTLDAAARRGKLPGFNPAVAGDHLFYVADFGTPFESVLLARYEPGGVESTLRFDVKLRPTAPTIFLVALAATVWPGVWFTHSLLVTYFSWYTIQTWWWYLPLTILSIPPAMWAVLKKSRQSAQAEARELIGRIAGHLGGRAEEASCD